MPWRNALENLSWPPDLEDSDEKFHRNIRILDNEFHLYDYPVLYARLVDGLEFKGNQLIRSQRFPPFHPRKYGFSLLDGMQLKDLQLDSNDSQIFQAIKCMRGI